MTDHEKTIRTALERAFQITSKEPCGPSNNLMIEALASLTALQEERERMQAALGRIARLITHSLIPDTNEIYHQCYMALVGDLTLPASQQAEIMRAAIEGAAMEPAPQLNRDEKWLREKAALEDGCFVSVGGLVTDLESPTTRPSDIDAATGTADDQIPTAVVDAMRAYVEGTGVTTVQYIETALSAASVETEDAATLRGDQSQQVEPCPHCAAGVPMSSQPGTHWNGDIVGIPCEGQSCPTCGQRENIVCSDAYHLTGTWKDGKPVKACECPHTKALRDLQSALDELELQHDPEKDAEAERLYECAREKARVALNTPCPCEGLRAELDSLGLSYCVLEGKYELAAEIIAKERAERDSLRARVADLEAADLHSAYATHDFLARIADLTAKLTASQERARKLREALEPFAAFSKTLRGVNEVPDALPINTDPSSLSKHSTCPKVGDLRRAEAALATPETKEKP